MKENKELCGWFTFYKDQLLIEKKNDTYTIPFGTEPPMPVPVGSTIHTIGQIDGVPAKAFSVHAPVPGSESDTHQMTDLRASYDYLPWEEYNLAGKAFQILNWDKNSRYCPMCGVPTQQISPIAKKCPQCRQEIYPRISPAIIVLIRKEDSILLVHARNFRGTFNGLVAGFLEPGETLEECVHREVLEETGLHIRNLKYFGSQPWPYPSGVMIGFTADYESGEIKLQEEELNAGAFYTKDNLPEIPRKLSLARKLIDAWLENSGK
jgi:NAD+ diphosphatase